MPIGPTGMLIAYFYLGCLVLEERTKVSLYTGISYFLLSLALISVPSWTSMN